MKTIITILLLTTSSIFAQKSIVKGSIFDIKTKKPVEFATVSLLNFTDSSFVKGDLTDTLGRFEFPAIPAGKFYISISSVEYQPKFSRPIEIAIDQIADIEPIMLVQAEQLLNEVTVTATKQAFEQKFGNFIVNVDSKVFKTATDALDILKRSLGVIVDGFGNITYRRTSPKILFDGKDLRMSADQEKAYLRTLTPEMIETIELMPSPPAKYESAWQTVINIKLKRDKTLGYRGSLFGNLHQGRFNSSSLGGNISYKTQKLAYSLTAGVEANAWWQRLIDDRTFSNGVNVNKIQGNSFIKSPSKSINITAGMEYTINPKNAIDFKITSGINKIAGITESTNNAQFANQQAQTILSSNEMPEQSKSITGIIGYKYAYKGKEFLAEFALADNQTDGQQDLKSDTFIDGKKIKYSNQKNDQSSGANFKTLSLNYAFPIKEKWQFETGIKINSVSNSAKISYDTLLKADTKTLGRDFTRSNEFLFN